jgi:hypothetical protein
MSAGVLIGKHLLNHAAVFLALFNERVIITAIAGMRPINYAQTAHLTDQSQGLSLRVQARCGQAEEQIPGGSAAA